MGQQASTQETQIPSTPLRVSLRMTLKMLLRLSLVNGCEAALGKLGLDGSGEQVVKQFVHLRALRGLAHDDRALFDGRVEVARDHKICAVCGKPGVSAEVSEMSPASALPESTNWAVCEMFSAVTSLGLRVS